MQLNVQALAWFDAGGIVQHMAVCSRGDDGVAPTQGRQWAERAQARSLGSQLLVCHTEVLGGVTFEPARSLARELTVLVELPGQGALGALAQCARVAEEGGEIGRE